MIGFYCWSVTGFPEKMPSSNNNQFGFQPYDIRMIRMNVELSMNLLSTRKHLIDLIGNMLPNTVATIVHLEMRHALGLVAGGLNIWIIIFIILVAIAAYFLNNPEKLPSFNS